MRAGRTPFPDNASRAEAPEGSTRLAMNKVFVILIAVTMTLSATSRASTPPTMSSVVPSLDVLAGDWTAGQDALQLSIGE